MKHTLWWVEGIYSNPRTRSVRSSCIPLCLPSLCLAGAMLHRCCSAPSQAGGMGPPLFPALCLQTPNLENSDLLSIPYLQAPAHQASAFLFHDLSYYSPCSRYFQRLQCTECILRLFENLNQNAFLKDYKTSAEAVPLIFSYFRSNILLKVNLDYLARVDPNLFFQFQFLSHCPFFSLSGS